MERGKTKINQQLKGATEIRGSMRKREWERGTEREPVSMMMIMRSSRTARELMMLPPHKLSTRTATDSYYKWIRAMSACSIYA